jgi:hypothetical protein
MLKHYYGSKHTMIHPCRTWLLERAYYQYRHTRQQQILIALPTIVFGAGKALIHVRAHAHMYGNMRRQWRGFFHRWKEIQGKEQTLAFALQDNGGIIFRAEYESRPAIDGQAGTILRIYREHQMSADNTFLKNQLG